MAVTAVVAWLSDVLVFKPLRGRSSVTLLIVSIATAFIIENIIRFIAGNDIRGFDVPLTRPVKFAGGIKATPEQLWLILITIIAMLVVFAMLKYTRLGKAMRATADNFSLAQVRGIDTGKIIMTTWLIGGALAGLAGLLLALISSLSHSLAGI